jgi:hypothetical protein
VRSVKRGRTRPIYRDVIVLGRLLCALAIGAALFVPATSVADDAEQRAFAGSVTVSEIGHGSVRVAATVTLGEGTTAYWFEYGPAPGLGTQTPASTATAGDEEDGEDGDEDGDGDDQERRVQVSRTLTGLPAGTLHNVRLVVDGSGGRSHGALATFTTAAIGTSAPPADPADPAAPPAPVSPAGPALPPADGPELGASFVAVAEQGSVRVRLPGGDRFVDLPRTASLPVGTIVDARDGTIALRTALPNGGEQRGSFWGASFKVGQSAKGGGRTDLYLRGGGFAGCRRQGRGTRALAFAAAKGERKPVRRLWGKDRGGRFRTHGRDSVTTVRGTVWSVTDRCDGTVTKVTEGAVDVRVRRTGRVVRVVAGERFLARHRR